MISLPTVIITLGPLAAVTVVLHHRLIWQSEAFPTRLLMTERQIDTDLPVPLTGVPDEVYVGNRGELIPVETKTRRQPRVYLTDIVQLSVYRTILRHSRDPGLPARWRRRVSHYGYVRAVTPRGNFWLKVRLLTDRKVIRYYRRRVRLERPFSRPRATRNPRICERCPYQQGCAAFKKRQTKSNA